jgi:hypothetical protein
MAADHEVKARAMRSRSRRDAPVYEVHDMSDLQREGVVRVLDGDILRDPRGDMPLARREVFHDAQMGTLVRRAREDFGGLQVSAGHGESVRLDPQQMQIGVENPGHDEKSLRRARHSAVKPA